MADRSPQAHRRCYACTLSIVLLPLVLQPLRAVETRVWDQSEQSDFLRGTVKNMALRSDGHVGLGLASRELDSTSVPYLWALAQDSHGTVFYAGGAPTGASTRIFRLSKNGKPGVLAEIPGLEIHALAVDKQDRVYAAVLPDAKIYRIDKAGKPELFFDPKCKYIWAMSFDGRGNLFVATGDSGVIYRVNAAGKGTSFFDSEETHVRSMLIEESGNLIVGTEPNGLVMRITPEGKSFVLYETNKREVTAVAEHAGQIYAASVGSKSGAAVVTGPSPVLPSAPAAPASGAGTPRPGAQPPVASPAVGSFSATVTGGSDVYRIDKYGFAERIWQSPSDIVYALAFDGTGKALIGTGNKGAVYRLDSDQLFAQALITPPTQVTALLPCSNGSMYVATGNVGNLYELSGSTASSGTLTSDVLDAHEFTYWGKAHVTAEMRNGQMMLETRSGNLNNPETNWSAWEAVPVSKTGGQVPSPPARFLQYRLTLKGGRGNDTAGPEVSAVDIAYLPKNIAPRIRAVEVEPLNYRENAGNSSLDRNTNAAGSPLTLTLPAVGQKRTSLAGSSSEGSAGVTLQYSKGFITTRWSAVDSNDDPLLFTVELRSKEANSWRVLKDKLADRFYSFDTAAFPDGDYFIRITATDAPGNIPSEALTGTLESDSFHIDNTPPEVTDIKVMPEGNKQRISWAAKDAISWIGKAEYSLNGIDWVAVNPVNKVTDSQTLSYQVTVDAGQSIAIRVFDENDNVQVKQVNAH